MFPKFKGNDWYVFGFTAEGFKGELINSPGLAWMVDDQSTSLNLWESDHGFMLWMQEEKFFSAMFEYEGDEMHRYDVVFHTTNKLEGS